MTRGLYETLCLAICLAFVACSSPHVQAQSFTPAKCTHYPGPPITDPDDPAACYEKEKQPVRSEDVPYSWRREPEVVVHSGGPPLESLTYSPDGKVVLSSGGGIKMWDGHSGRLLKVLARATPDSTFVGFSPKGDMFASTDMRKVRLWSYPSTQLLLELPASGTLTAVAFSPDGRLLAAVKNTNGVVADYSVQLWDLQAKSLRAEFGHSKGIYGVSFSSDGKWLASADEGTVKFWNLEHDTLACKLQTDHKTNSIAFMPNANTLAIGSNYGSVAMFDPGSCRYSGKGFQQGQAVVAGLAFSPDAKTLAMSMAAQDEPQSKNPASPRSLMLWNLAAREVEAKVLANSTVPIRFSFSPDANTLAIGGEDGTVKIWDIETQHYVPTPQPSQIERIEDLTLSSDGKSIAWIGESGQIAKAWLWRFDGRHAPEVLASMPKPTAQIPRMNLAFSPDGHTVALGVDKNLEFWDTSTGKRLETLEPFTTPVGCFTYTTDGFLVVVPKTEMPPQSSVSTMTAIRPEEPFLLDPKTGHKSFMSLPPEVLSPRMGFDTPYHTDGSATLVCPATVGPGRRVGSVQSGLTTKPERAVAFVCSSAGTSTKPIELTDGPICSAIQATDMPHFCVPLAWSAEGRLVAALLGDGKVKVWDTITGRPLFVLDAPKRLEWASFSPDGRTLAAGGALWNARTGSEFADLKGFSSSAVYMADMNKVMYARSCEQDIGVWDGKTGQTQAAMLAYPNVYVSAISTDGSMAVQSAPIEIGTSKTWGLRVFTRDTRKTIPAQDETISTINSSGGKQVFSPDGSILASSAWRDAVIKLFEVHTGSLLAILPAGSRMSSFSFSADSKLLITAQEPGTIKFWPITALKVSGTVRQSVRETPVLRESATLALLSDGNWAVVASDGRFDASLPSESLAVYWVANNKPIPLSDGGHHVRGLLQQIQDLKAETRP